MIPSELATGPPGPEMRRPGFTTWPTRECRFSEPTDTIYASDSRLSSALSWKETASQKGEICR
jgi:hypothetical protein